MNSFDDGYHAGLTNDRENPHYVWSLAYIPWRLGNEAGLMVHCAMVEEIYLKYPQ